MGLLRLQPLCGCAMGGIAYARTHRKGIVNMVWCLSSSIFFGVCDTPLHLRMAALIMPLRVTRRYNRGAVTTSITPHWRRRRLCGDTRISPPSTTAARLQTPPNVLWFTWRVMCHQRWQTMLNRGWSASVTCGSRMLYICSASKMSNIIVPLRGTYLLGVHFPQAAPRRGLQAVKHGSAPLALLHRPSSQRETYCFFICFCWQIDVI